MTVAMIITGLSTGGAETMLLKLLENMNRTRFRPHVISLGSMGDIGQRIQALGVPVEAMGMRPDISSVAGFFRLHARLRSLKPDVVHTWMYHSDFLGGLAAKLAGVEHIVWGVRHSNLEPGLNKSRTLRIVRLCAWISTWVPDRILLNSEKAVRVHAGVGYDAGKMVKISNGFDLKRFAPDPSAGAIVRRELGLETTCGLIGLVARNDPQKNISGYIQAAALVAGSRADVHFLLAGEGLDGYNESLDREIRKHGLAGKVHPLGRRSDIPTIMASLDVLVSSSHGEAFPNVLGEAMASGVPCAATDAGDSEEILGGTGRIVSVGDMDGLAQAILGLMSLSGEERRALGARARDRVRKEYDIVEVVRQHERLYDSLGGDLTACAD